MLLTVVTDHKTDFAVNWKNFITYFHKSLFVDGPKSVIPFLSPSFIDTITFIIRFYVDAVRECIMIIN